MGDREKRIVYIIRSESAPARHYVGITSDLAARLDWHNRGPGGYTTAYRPWSVVVSLEFRTERLARRFETYLKSGSGRAFAKRHFADSGTPNSCAQRSVDYLRLDVEGRVDFRMTQEPCEHLGGNTDVVRPTAIRSAKRQAVRTSDAESVVRREDLLARHAEKGSLRRRMSAGTTGVSGDAPNEFHGMSAAIAPFGYSEPSARPTLT